jgi:hypothetical protein
MSEFCKTVWEMLNALKATKAVAERLTHPTGRVMLLAVIDSGRENDLWALLRNRHEDDACGVPAIPYRTVMCRTIGGR